MYASDELRSGRSRAAIVRDGEVSESLKVEEPTTGRWRADTARQGSAADRRRAKSVCGAGRLSAERCKVRAPGRIVRLAATFDRGRRDSIGIQRGLYSTVMSGEMAGRFQEARIRHCQRRVDDFINEKQG